MLLLAQRSGCSAGVMMLNKGATLTPVATSRWLGGRVSGWRCDGMGGELNAAIPILESETDADDVERLTVGCAATSTQLGCNVATKRWATQPTDGVPNATLDVCDDASTANHIRVKLPTTLQVTSYKVMR